MQFDSKILIDGIYPSEYWSSIIPRSVANCVENLKKTNIDGLTDDEVRQKKFPAKTLPTE
jgi:hypothetical protein